MQTQIENMGKVQLRAACRDAKVTGYSKMTVAGMRAALAALTTVPEPVAKARPARLVAEERNGVRAPIQGVCRDLWGALNDMVAKGLTPDAAAVRDLSEKRKWNQNNSSIELSRWRKFHGYARPTRAA